VTIGGRVDRLIDWVVWQTFRCCRRGKTINLSAFMDISTVIVVNIVARVCDESTNGSRHCLSDAVWTSIGNTDV